MMTLIQITSIYLSVSNSIQQQKTLFPCFININFIHTVMTVHLLRTTFPINLSLPSNFPDKQSPDLNFLINFSTSWLVEEDDSRIQHRKGQDSSPYFHLHRTRYYNYTRSREHKKKVICLPNKTIALLSYKSQ